MMLPFTAEQFFEGFRQYNLAVWPMQAVLFLAAVAAAALVLKKTAHSDKIIPVILASLWLWAGAAYHLLFFTSINSAAYVFGALFILQGVLIAYAGLRGGLQFRLKQDGYGVTGAILIIFSLLIYPALNYLLGHWFPSNPTFGLPCPVVIFTFGLLLMSERAPKHLLAIPFLWSIIGMSAAINLGVWEDLGLIVAGAAGTTMLLYRDWSKDQKPAATSS